MQACIFTTVSDYHQRSVSGSTNFQLFACPLDGVVKRCAFVRRHRSQMSQALIQGA